VNPETKMLRRVICEVLEDASGPLSTDEITQKITFRAQTSRLVRGCLTSHWRFSVYRHLRALARAQEITWHPAHGRFGPLWSRPAPVTLEAAEIPEEWTPETIESWLRGAWSASG
jgi:hypothetical protein